MALFDRNAFLSFIIDNRVVGFFEEPVTLKSGRISRFYVNWRKVSEDVFLTDRLSDFLIGFVSDLGLKPDAFYGVPEGASKIGIISTYKWARAQKGYAAGSHSLSMGRGRPKEHGAPEDRYFLGKPRGRVVVVEDVTTTGGSLLSTIGRLKEIGAQIIAAVGLTNRMERRDDGLGVEEAVAKTGVKYYSLSDATEFLPEVCRVFKPSASIIRSIEEEFEKYGVEVKLTFSSLSSPRK